MELQVGVKVLLKNKEGKFLILRRSAEKYPEAGPQWEVPGGRIDPGVSLMENLNREVQEETGLVVSGAPKLIAAQDIIRGGPKNRHIVRLTYMSTADGEVKLSDEHTDFQWLTLTEIAKLDPLDQFLKAVLNTGNF